MKQLILCAAVLVAVPATAGASEWVLVERLSVDSAEDRDVVAISELGRVDQIALIVEGGDIRIDGVTVALGDGDRFTRMRDARLRAGDQRGFAIPGKARTIRSVTLDYGNLRRGRARVAVWARVVTEPLAAWSDAGWRRVDRVRARARHGVASVTIRPRAYDRLSLVPSDPGLKILAVRVHYAGGGQVRVTPTDDAPSDLRTAVAVGGIGRPISRVTVRYENRTQRGASIEVFAR
jgi:hypothetical protein